MLHAAYFSIVQVTHPVRHTKEHIARASGTFPALVGLVAADVSKDLPDGGRKAQSQVPTCQAYFVYRALCSSILFCRISCAALSRVRQLYMSKWLEREAVTQMARKSCSYAPGKQTCRQKCSAATMLSVIVITKRRDRKPMYR